MQRKQLNIWVPLELAERVEAAAEADDRSVSTWLRRLIIRELDPDPDLVAAGEDAA